MTRTRTSLSGRSWSGIACSFLAASAAHAQTVDLPADLDATIYDDLAEPANGAGNYIFAGFTAGGNERRALLRFDVTGIPAGATINSVTLTLEMNMTIAGDEVIELHRVLEQWNEGPAAPGGQEGGGTTAMPGDTTWSARVLPGCAWSTAGGSFAAAVSGSATVGLVNGPYAFTGAGLAADVQAWIDGTQPNHGWILKDDQATGFATAKRFASRSFPTPAIQPKLTVNYTAGAGCGAVNYCGPAVVNSSGCAARTWWTGSCTVADASFTITAEGLPAGQFGYFITSQNKGFFSPPAAVGFVCLSGNIGRFNAPGQVISGPSGSILVNLASIPTNPMQAVVPGDTWNFQCWYRDSGNTSNFTDGLQVTFD